MTEREYRQHPAISRSELWLFHESPEKFLWHKDHPEPPTPALLFGQAVHKLVLLPDEFDTEFAVMPEFDGRTKDGRALRTKFLDSVGDRTVISTEMYVKAETMATALRKAPYVSKLLSGDHEKPFFWTDELTGEECKCRVDCITQIGGRSVVVDYKTTSDASNDGFMRSAIKFGYNLQSAMYLDGSGADAFVFIAQEKDPPYAVNIFEADEAFVQNGRDLFREYIGTYHYCKANDNFYGYMGRDGLINNLSLPAWMKED